MIERLNDKLVVFDENESFQAEHSLYTFGGPQAISFGKDKIIEEVLTYCGEDLEDAAVIKKIKDYHKQGSSIVNYTGKLPYGNEVEFEHTYRYRSNRVRITSDINIPAGASIDRHFGLGSLFLPGKWEKMYVMPPAQHQVDGAGPYFRKIPKYSGEKVMVGHWHRPPLSVVFYRKNGTRVEIGTGSDLWRWEKSFGYHPESGNYKIILHEDGLEFVREPLACCETFTPVKGQYRFSWYIAWDQERIIEKPNHNFKYVELNADGKVDLSAYKDLDEDLYVSMDISEIEWPENFYRCDSPVEYVIGEGSEVSWMNGSFVTRMRKIARQLIEDPKVKGLRLKGMEPGISFHSAHVNKKDALGTVHWDINALMDFTAWFKDKAQAENKLELFLDIDEDWNLPSVKGLFS